MCPLLESIKFSEPGFPRLTKIGERFMLESGVKQEITIASAAMWPSLRVIGQYSLHQMAHLTTVRIEDLPALAHFSADFLGGCPELVTASFINLPRLEEIGIDWLSGSFRLASLTLKDLPELWSIGNQWLERGAGGMIDLVVEDLPKLQQIGHRCLQGLKSVENVRFHNLPALTSVGDGLLSHCPKLKTLGISNVPMLTRFITTCKARMPTSETARFLDRSPAATIHFAIDDETVNPKVQEIIRKVIGLDSKDEVPQKGKNNSSCNIS